MTSRDFVYWLQGYFEILESNKTILINGWLDSSELKLVMDLTNLLGWQ